MNYQEQTLTQQSELSRYITKVFLFMFLGLLITAATSFITVYLFETNNSLVRAVFGNQIVFWGIIIVQFALVIGLTAGIRKFSTPVIMLGFLLYALLNGVMFSTILYAYEIKSVAVIFGVACLMFGSMAVYGLVTNEDLTKFRSILFMALIGIIIASIVNIFLKNGIMDMIISIIGVVVFVGLTAYDTQKIKSYYYMTDGNEKLRANIAISAALNLYLDFINIFIYLLRLFGKRK